MIRRFFSSRWTIFFLGIIVGTAFVAPLVHESEGEVLGESSVNLVANGSFEKEGTGPAGDGWNFDAAKMKGKGTASRSPDARQDGNVGLKLEATAANANAGAEPLGVGQFIPARRLRENRLHVSARLGAEGGVSAVVGVSALRRNGSEIARAILTENKKGESLKLAEAVLDIPNPKEVANILVFLVVNGGPGTAYFDDIVITAGKPAAAARVDSTDPLATTIQIDANKVLRPIPRELFGTNIEWIENGNGILDPRTGRFDPTVVELAHASGVSLIRYPGGLFSDHFHWRDSIGPRDRRPTRQHFPKGPSSKLLMGTEEALDFARQVGAELFITVNAGSGTAEEAADWVNYIRKNHPDDPVRFWEIGNEIYMKSFDASSPPAFDMGPAAYADRVVAFASAMRKVDPTIKLGAISADNFTTVPLTDHLEWSEVVLKRAAGSIDFIAVHNAYAPLVVDGKGNPRDIYLGLLAAPGHIQKSLADLSRKIDQWGGKNAERIKIAVTEWGPFFQVGVEAPYVDHPKTLGSALFVASTMKAFLDTPKVEIAHFFKLTEPTFMGWMGPRGGKIIPKAPLFALQMFARHFGNELVASTAQSPTFDAPAVGLMPTASGVPWVEVCASRGDDGKLYLLVINKHFSAPANASIAVDGFVPSPEGIAWTLTGTAMDANTGTELPRIPGLNWAKQAEVDPGMRMNRGNPNEVTLTSKRVEGLAAHFEFQFPPRSVTSIEMASASAPAP